MAYEAAKEEAEDRAEKAEQKVSVTLEEKKTQLEIGNKTEKQFCGICYFTLN